MLKELEEENFCSGGFCNAKSTDMLDKYLFSNINNGLPKKNCHESLKHLILKNLN